MSDFYECVKINTMIIPNYFFQYFPPEKFGIRVFLRIFALDFRVKENGELAQLVRAHDS